MNVTVENLAPCRKLLRVEVDAQAVDSAFEQLTKEFQKEVRLAGFRPGKAPRDLVVKTYARQIEEETRRKLISETYRKALTDHKLEVVGAPDIEEIQFGRGQPLQFAARIETAPEFELPAYKGLPVKRDPATVSEADVERAFNVLREQRITYKDVARPAEPGDIVVVNYSGTTDGKPLLEIAPTARGLTQQNGFWLQIKPGSFIPGFTEQLVGAVAGDKRTVTVDFPVEFVAPALSGRKGIYEVEILQVKERMLPELNDEFARAYGAENVEKLREGVRRDLANELNYKQKRDVRNQLVGGLLNRVNFELPESMVQQETRTVVFDIVRENQQRGVPKEKIEEQKDQIYSVANRSAKDRVKAAFLLGKIADKENLKVSEQEIMQRILFLAQQNNIRPEKFIKQLRERNGVAEIHEQILSAKVLDFLELNAQVHELPGGSNVETPEV
ncbi:MAG: trigger factor [Verrucomicrobiales bacterium]|nr:trigger factor [Verrucomicrobiales bacterium]